MTPNVALVTGASGDIGQAICTALARIGLAVIATSRSEARLAALAARWPGKIEPVAADLTDDAGRAAVERAAAQHGRLDLVVLGSGIYERSREPAALRRQLASNVEAPYALLRMLLPLLIHVRGHVVFLNSSLGHRSPAELGAYAATHHAMRAIADSLREEVNERGVRVASIFLGRTATTRQAAIFAMEGRAYTPERLIQPDDVAAIVLSLAAQAPTVEVTDIALRPRLKP